MDGASINLATHSISRRVLLGQLLGLAVPVIVEQVFHIVVGLTDTWLANNLPRDAAAATAAVGSISYLMWFIGLIVAAVGTGSTALIARAKGARHRGLANGVCGQSISAGLALGVVMALGLYFGAHACIDLTGLSPTARGFAFSYLRMLTVAVPLLTVMFVANACLRGAGDTLTPAVSMVIVDIVNIALSFGLTFGWWGLPRLGFNGIAAGTVIAYIVGGLLQLAVLLAGRGGIQLHLHRLRPHWHTLRRLLRVGIPSGLEGLLTWVAQFSVVVIINRLDKSNISAAAHLNTVKIESLSYMPGFALAMAAATMTGQALGAKDPQRAVRATHLACAVAAGVMGLCGLIFIFFGRYLAGWMLPSLPSIADLTGRCLFVTGFIQTAFAASMVYSGALRGAGDTVAVMAINLASTIGIRLVGVLLVTLVLGHGIVAVWCVLSGELCLRGVFVWLRYRGGRWKHVEV